MSLSLGIDVGTSGVRTAVMDGDRLISMARAEHPPQDASNIDANGWWSAVVACLHAQVSALAADGISAKTITRIAVDGTSGSMVLTDSDLAPVGPALMYNSKGFEDEAAQIETHLEGPHITRGQNSALARAMRLAKLSDPTAKHLLHQADFIAAKLLRCGGHSDYNNALKTGFDPETRTWPAWIDQVIDPNLLPKVHAPGSAIATINRQVAEELGLSEQATIHAGTTDSIAAFLTSAPLEEGVAVTSLGSTLAIKMLSSQRIDDPDIGLYAHRLGDLWLVGGASNTGGAVLRHFFEDEALAKLSTRIDPKNPQDLDFYPLLAPGERFPINDPDLPPKMTPRPDDDAQFLQALFEGMAAIEARCYAAIAEKGGGQPHTIFTAGGGAKNEVWSEIRKLALGQMPKTPAFSEAAIGTARLAQSG